MNIPIRESCSRLACAVVAATAFLLAPAARADVVIDLADIVGGGDGTGTGGNQGINLVNGGVQNSHSGAFFRTPNVFVPSGNPFVDGVFVPDGGVAGVNSITVSSTGITVSGVSNWQGSVFINQNTYDHLWNGHNLAVGSSLTGSIIGAHANKGITFDIDAIEAANPGTIATSFDVTAALGNTNVGVAQLYAYVDGTLINQVILGPNAANTAVPFGSVPLGPDDRFLTLLTSSRGDIQADWSFWLDPTITLQQANSNVIPEPSSILVWTLLGVIILMYSTSCHLPR